LPLRAARIDRPVEEASNACQEDDRLEEVRDEEEQLEVEVVRAVAREGNLRAF